MTQTDNQYHLATFAGGCFWCMIPPFSKLEGVLRVTAGYTGGQRKNPTYEQVSTGATGHVEAVEVLFNPAKITYEKLLDTFWRQIDPSDPGGQFADRGSQYQTAIFYHDDNQRKIAEESRVKMEAAGIFQAPIATPILPAATFYPAEEYHQDYHQKNPAHYRQYRIGSGREGFLARTWSTPNEPVLPAAEEPPRVKPDPDQQKRRLTPLQYRVTQENGTEPPFANEYWDNRKDGIYVDIVSGKPLFSSLDKFDSGCGWPSFTQPLSQNEIVASEDRSYGMIRTEVRSKTANSHLGHVFEDGPAPRELRYCINSAALRFIPVEKLEEEGYGEYRKFFK